MAQDFILEIGTEELPARFIQPALDQLKEMAAKNLQELRLEYKKIETYATPRRLVLYVREVDEKQAALRKEVKGPAQKVAFDAEGKPTKAILGFARGQKVGLEDLEVRSLNNVNYMYAVINQEGRSAVQVLADLAPQLISGLHFPRPMHWGSLEYRFARPIRWLLALYGAEIVPFTLADLASNRFTYGHRFLSSGPLKVASSIKYFQVMENSYVMVDQKKREQVIWQQIQQLAASVEGQVQENQDLLSEITNIVEYPTALMGVFAEKYLNLPNDVIITPMREHQRYFPVLNKEGKLLPKFIAVRNGTQKHLDIVAKGNEKVLAARLADAEFFFAEDLKTTLADKVKGLEKVVWLEGLGTVYEKSLRIGRLADYLAVKLDADEKTRKDVARSAQLAKADLVTNVVCEFTELQGTMGKEYALRNGEAEAVATGIYEHYLPRFAGDQLPQTIVGTVLSLADKIDSIVGCFGMGIQPTGSQDPFALRRQALGMVNILLEGQLNLGLKEMVVAAYGGYEGKVNLKVDLETVVQEVTLFFQQRIKGIFLERGFAYDTVDAVLEADYSALDQALKRVKALTAFRQEEAFGDLITAFNRANNLAKKAEKEDISLDYLSEPAEKELYAAYLKFTEKLEMQLAAMDYPAVLHQIALLLKPINNFFEQVMVMVEDESVRCNRLALLKNIADKMKKIADFSMIVS